MVGVITAPFGWFRYVSAEPAEIPLKQKTRN